MVGILVRYDDKGLSLPLWEPARRSCFRINIYLILAVGMELMSVDLSQSPRREAVNSSKTCGICHRLDFPE